MKTINLSDLENSDIKYKISQFPDGQQDIVIKSEYTYKRCGISGKESKTPVDKSIEVTIKSRFNSFRDLELIICATKALKRLGVKKIHLYIPYLLGARSDRHFQEGGNSYLVDVIAPIINAQNFETVTVLDVHSDVAPACINNLRIEDNYELVHFALNSAKWNTIEAYKTRQQYSNDKCILVSPDAGASKKIQKLADKIDYTGDIITCSKERDTNGKLTKTVVPLTSKHIDKDLIIIDDICDGGRTFINIAKQIKENTQGEIGKLYLIVTHGIFSAGYTELLQYFDGIYTTNSIKNIGGLDGNSNKVINVKQIKVI